MSGSGDYGSVVIFCPWPDAWTFARPALRVQEGRYGIGKYLLGRDDARELQQVLMPLMPERTQKAMRRMARKRKVRAERRVPRRAERYSKQLMRCQQLADAICDQLGLPRVLVELARGRAGAYCGGSYQVVQIGAKWLDGPEGELRALLAHEIGHHQVNIEEQRQTKAYNRSRVRNPDDPRSREQWRAEVDAERERQQAQWAAEDLAFRRQKQLNWAVRIICAALYAAYLFVDTPDWLHIPRLVTAPIGGVLFTQIFWGAPRMDSWREEFACDRLAVEIAGEGPARAMLSRATFLPGSLAWLEIIWCGVFDSHPPTAVRLRRMRSGLNKALPAAAA
jgi:hypothetical protein